MQINARFEKVSFTQFAEYGNEQTYNELKIPTRATELSAGYDFFAPTDITFEADYVNSPNEGHIFVRMTNESDKTLEIKKGEAFAQGILLAYNTTADDCVTEQRKGGLGSTTKPK